MFCVYCGADNEAGAKFCAQCGREMKSPLQEVRMENTPQVSKKNTNSKKVFLIIGGIVIAAVVAIAAILISGSIKEKEYQAKVEKGFKYLEEQEYEKAEAEFLAAIEIEAKDIKVYKGLVETYEQMERDDDVADVYETIVTLVDDEYKDEEELSSENEELYLSAIQCFKEKDDRKKVLMLLGKLQDMTESEELSVQLSEDEEVWGRYGGYLELLYEYAEKYGMNDVIYPEEMLGYLEGLAFAKLLDFDGNGTEELMVAYSFKEDGAGKAFIEVWDYIDGEMVKIFEEEPFTQGDPEKIFATILMNEIDGKHHIITGYKEEFVSTEYKLWARNGEKFDLISTQETIEKDGERFCYVDGKEISSEAWYNEYCKWYNETYLDFGLLYNMDYLCGYSKVELDKTIDILEKKLALSTSKTNSFLDKYAEILYGYINDNGTYDERRFALAYIDEDDIPELLIFQGNYHSAGTEVYTVYKNELYSVGTFGSNGSIEYAEKQNLICSYYSGQGNFIREYFSINEGEACLEKSITYTDYDMETGKEAFKIDEKNVSGEEYNFELIQYQEGFEWTEKIGYIDGYEINEQTIADMLKRFGKETLLEEKPLPKSLDYKAIYADAVNDAINYCSQYGNLGEPYIFCEYTLSDVTGDGISEIFVHVHYNKHGADLLIYSYDGQNTERIGNIPVDINRNYVVNSYETGFIHEEGYKGSYELKYYQWNGSDFTEELLYSTHDLDWRNSESPEISMEDIFETEKIKKSLPMVDIYDDSVFEKMKGN